MCAFRDQPSVDLAAVTVCASRDQPSADLAAVTVCASRDQPSVDLASVAVCASRDQPSADLASVTECLSHIQLSAGILVEHSSGVRIVPYSSSENSDEERISVDCISDSESDVSLDIPVYERICSHLAADSLIDRNVTAVHNKGDNIITNTHSSTSRFQQVDTDDDDGDGDGDGDDDDTGDGRDRDELSLRVAVAKNAYRRKWDKKYYCKFCMKPQSKLPRHLQLKHKEEPEIAALDCMPLKSRRRKLHLRKLLNDGNYQHNVDVLKRKAGEIVPCKRPSSLSAHEKFIPCEFCLAMFVRSSLWKHKKNCPFKPDSQAEAGSRHCQGSGSLLLPFSSEASEGLKRDVLSAMHQDEVTAAVRTDDLIMRFGSRMHFKHGHIQHRQQYIRERIRQIGRLLVKMKNTTKSVNCLADCIVPEYFEQVVKAVRCLCGFDEDAHMYTTPSLALKMGHSLKECVRLEINRCTIQGSSAADKKKKCEEFLSLCDSEWSHEVSSHALRSLHLRKFNKPVVLPLAEDVKKLHQYLTANAEASRLSLCQEPTVNAWSELCQLTLAQIVTFNRRRGGEAQRMLLSTYSTANENLGTDVTKCLSQVEQALCKEFRVVHIEGKRGRKVPVLLTKTAQAQIGLLIELRSAVGIPDTNVFVFARKNSLQPYRSSDCLRRFARECGATNASALTSTKLRKHIATMSQMLALRSHELDLLANFLGHDISVHREFYRLPEQTLQVAKVSKLLIAMERGDTVSLQGRNLDNVDVNVTGGTRLNVILFILLMFIKVVCLATDVLSDECL